MIHDITEFGAVNGTECTAAVRAALAACAADGGGQVYIPAGRYIVTRTTKESPILTVPSNTVVRGDGAASILQMPPVSNSSDFWRIFGASNGANITICDLALDGSNTHQSYVPGATPEHNTGCYFGGVENLTLRDLFITNFSGDGLYIADCYGVTIRDITLWNFVRHGIQIAGSPTARDYLVTGCRDLEPTVRAGGSTIHAEHCKWLQNLTVTDNHCRQSIVTGDEIAGLLIANNHVIGYINASVVRDAVISGNIIRPFESLPSAIKIQYSNNVLISGNILECSHESQTGIYAFGRTKTRPDQAAKNIYVIGSVSRGPLPFRRGVWLNGVDRYHVAGNSVLAGSPVVIQRSTGGV